MKRKIIMALVIWVFSLTAVYGQKNWKEQIEKIKPLVTTESEVEKILGKAVDRFSFIGKYETKEGTFTVYYSEGKCLPDPLPKYNVEKGAVIEIN